ncbi:MAG TPA: integrase core domain-containing protein [Candidatus Saccharimonadales bacterium]|nr:integrase core domain-containing protein [Candidatus Saccharimonadales bacterium]
MYGKVGIGTPSSIRDVAPPKLKQIRQTVTLSKEAKLRLTWVDYYHAHGKNAALVGRHFGIARSCFNKWKKRYDERGLKGLETLSKRPAHVRESQIPPEVISAVKMLRKANPEYSKYKLEVILKRDYGYRVSSSTIGRIIAKYGLYYAPPVKQKGHPGRRQSIAKLRKPKDFEPVNPGDLIEVDVKHLPHINGRRYGFVAIDVVSKQAAVHVSSTISSTQGVLAWKKAVHQLGLPKAVLTDNGSENMGAFTELLKQQPTEHYWARPYTPKDKPHVERFIGTLERECLQWGGVTIDQKDQQDIIDVWLKKYHTYRPHQALDYLTPDEYKAKLTT